MTLNHINIAVPVIAEARPLFESYFGFRCIHDEGDNKIAVLTDQSGFVLTLSNFEKADAFDYPKAFHIGFGQKSREDVNHLYERLKAGGIDAKTPKEFHGAWTFYLHAPGGFLVEVFYQETRGGQPDFGN
jgi:catechol 2,3-dioxygenase-like lactoylglutathione lyase family enzyme